MRRIAGFLAAVLITGSGYPQSAISVNGSFESGATGWIVSGGASVVATGEPDDNPFGRVPDGGLVFLYQKVWSDLPQVAVAFDFYTGLMSQSFPSPGGFPDTAFATVYFGATDSDLQPELLQSGAALALFDFDAVNGLSRVAPGATVTDSPVRPGWTRFDGTLEVFGGQPFFAVTFQTLNANGSAGDSALLVDNLRITAVPEPGTVVLLIFGLAAILGGGRGPNRGVESAGSG